MPALVLRPAPRRVANPKADPRFVAVTEQVKASANKLKKHAPPAQKAREASKSAKAPPNERLAGAKAKVVDAVKEAPAPKPQPSSFKALLRAEIEKAMPKTLGDTEKFMQGEQAGAMKGSLAGNVSQQKATATGPVDAATRQAPNPGAVPATPSAPLPSEPTPQPPLVAGGNAMPPPVTPAEASLEQSKKDTAQALADHKIKPESLQRANDPRFSAVAAAQKQVAVQTDKAPAAFRAKESAILGGARAQAGGVAARGTLLLAGTRGRGNARVLTRQQQQAQKEEEARRKVATDIEAIFNRTKSKVETRLANLDTEVAAIFDPGVDAALNTMKRFVDARITRYKLERYLTIPIVGLARWLRDQALGLPEEVNAFYVQGRAVFQAAMDRLIDRIANLVETRLAQAKADVAAGQAEIKSYVVGLPANLKAAGQAAEKAMGDRFAELTTSIEDKKNELASSLAQKYKEAFDKADEALKQMQDENKGLLQKFAEKLAEVVKALAEFKARLMAILRKAADTIDRILEDPGQFLSNLINAIKQGFQRFAGNILTHLANGFAKWLFGALAGAGIEIPSDLTLPSILKLVLGVLGITYERMRAKAVRLLGPTAVGIIEKAVEYVRALIAGGPAALWEKVKEDLSDLKAMVIDAIKDWLIATIVKRAVAKVVSMFNPVGAIIQIILMIVSVVQFVVERAAQIMEFVEAVVNSFAAIASGAIGGAASWIERALGNMVPILIGFLASLLGLGGISAKIKETILKVQNKVDKAIDKAIAKVVGVVKKLFGKGGKAGKPTDKTGDRLQQGLFKKPFSMGPEGHTVTAKLEQGQLKLTVATTEADLILALSGAIRTVSNDNTRPEIQRKAILGHLQSALVRAQSIRQDWIAADAREPTEGGKKVTYERFMTNRVSETIASIKRLERYQISDLQAILSKPKVRKIPSGFNIRKRLYDDATQGKWTTDSKTFRDLESAKISAKCHAIWLLRNTNFAAAQTQWDALLAKSELDPEQIPTFTSYDHPKHFPKFKYQTDHKKPLGEFWNNGENDKDDAARAKSALDQTNWQLLTRKANREKSGVSFKREVGVNFSSTVANSPKNADTIDGKPFKS